MKLKTATKLLLVSLSVFLMRILLRPAGYEFRWAWLNVFAELAFPAILLVSILLCATKIKYVILRIVTVLMVSAYIFYSGFVYMMASKSTMAEYYFRSPSGENVLIAVRICGFPHYSDIRFYESKFFILKKVFDDYDRPYYKYPPLERGDYTVEWNKEETECTVKWQALSSKEDNTTTLTFNRN